MATKRKRHHAATKTTHHRRRRAAVHGVAGTRRRKTHRKKKHGLFGVTGGGHDFAYMLIGAVAANAATTMIDEHRMKGNLPDHFALQYPALAPGIAGYFLTRQNDKQLNAIGTGMLIASGVKTAAHLMGHNHHITRYMHGVCEKDLSGMFGGNDEPLNLEQPQNGLSPAMLNGMFGSGGMLENMPTHMHEENYISGDIDGF